MKSATLLRLIAGLACVALCFWIVTHTRWEDVEVDNDPHGAAATDEYYSLRQVLQAAGATLETRTSLEPMPPADATLMLSSSLWAIFPERDARLKAWVENGGHLVVVGRFARGHDDLRWVPLTFVRPPKPRRAHGVAPSADDAASQAEDSIGDDEDDEVPTARKKPDDQKARQQRARLRKLLDPDKPWTHCTNLDETDATTEPAFERGEPYRACATVGTVRTLNHVAPTWQLTDGADTLAMRVPLGRGNVTGVSPELMLDNHGLLHGDNALIAAAVLQAMPGRAVWIIGDEAREPLLGWLWHEARTPSLLALAAIALALWRLMVRFGPREAVPPQTRRSMGEQVRGTGRFVAGIDATALHAATRIAFEDAARKRVENWAGLDDPSRIAALAEAVAHSHAIDQPALLVSLNIGGGATPAQVLAATTVLEQARRALLRTPPTPPVS